MGHELNFGQERLDGGANRATLASRLVILSPLLQASSVGGQVAVSSGLRWDAQGLSVRLQDPRAEHLRIDGVTGNDAQILERISASVVQEALQGYPLLTFRPEEFRFGFKVQGITIGADEIRVKFEQALAARRSSRRRVLWRRLMATVKRTRT